VPFSKVAVYRKLQEMQAGAAAGQKSKLNA